MNRYAYRTTGLAIKTISALSRANIKIHGRINIPADGSKIFVVNHFTRFETFLLPYSIFKIIKVPVWSLASHELFKGGLGAYLEKVGGLSNKDPDRDRLIVKTLLTGEAAWIIFPEGRMVKSKQIFEKGRFVVGHADGVGKPHTGAAALALRTEFYRLRLRHLSAYQPGEAKKLLDKFGIDDPGEIETGSTYIIPVNLTYFPLTTQENLASRFAQYLVEDLPDRVMEELLAEGSYLFGGTDVTMRIGEPIKVEPCLECMTIQRDITAPRTITFGEVIPSRPQMRQEANKLMQTYMQAIYDLTTVNADHLMATVLLKRPFANMRIPELGERAFDLCIRLKEETALNLHRNLGDEDLTLITDDRHGWLADFVAMARKTGWVALEDNRLAKTGRDQSEAWEFHRVRIDNPAAVMVNEVKPLKAFQIRARRSTWAPRPWIRRRIARHLMERAQMEFEADYEAFYLAAESKPRAVGRPFLVKGRGRHLGVVLYHGYMAAPMEVLALARYLGGMGYWVYVPRLKGHGTAPEDLAQRSYQDWRRSAEIGYAVIRAICRRVVVGGFSTGAGLALDLASRKLPVAGVFAVSTPLRLQYLTSKLAPAVNIWNRLMGRIRLNDAKKEFVENTPENPHINYHRNPVAGVQELERLMGDLEPRLSSVEAPALIMQSAGDPVVSEKGSQQIFNLVGSEDKRYVLFNFQRHGIINGPGSEKVFRVIGNFLDDRLAEL